MKRIHLIIKGRVHGVFFRANAEEQANKLGVKGWIKNVDEGVEVVAEGEDEAIKQLIEYCRHGPMIAHVDDMVIKEEKPTGEFTSFDIHY